MTLIIPALTSGIIYIFPTHAARGGRAVTYVAGSPSLGLDLTVRVLIAEIL